MKCSRVQLNAKQGNAPRLVAEKHTEVFLHTLQYTVYTVQCTSDMLRCTLQYALYTVRCTNYTDVHTLLTEHLSV